MEGGIIIEEQPSKKPNAIGMAGAILGIISCAGSLIWSIILLMLITSPFSFGVGFFGLVWTVWNIITIVLISKFLKDKKYKTAAGVMTLIGLGLLGGIFILVSD